MPRITITDLQDKIKKGDKLVSLAAYTAPIAKIADEIVDVILVGDSLGMVIYGMESTLPVTLDLMVNHGKAVVSNSKKSFIVLDMPFGSYQESKEKALKNAVKLIKKTGAGAVKLEAGSELQDTIEYLSQRGIVVFGHIGLLPQHVNKLGGYKLQGQDTISEKKIIKDAIALERGGASILIVEGVKNTIIDKIKQKTKIPLIGIGASDKCDGQVLVIDDLLGIPEKTPKFVKRYAELGTDIKRSISAYANDVRTKKFPTKTHLY